MSYFDVKPESRYLAPAEINPSFVDNNMYSSLGYAPSPPSPTSVPYGGVTEQLESNAIGVLELAGLFGSAYAGYKGYGIVGAIGGTVLFAVADVAAYMLAGVFGSVLVSAYGAHQGYQACERSLWHSRTSLRRPTRVPTGLERDRSPRAPRRPTPCSTRSARRRPGRWWTTCPSCRGATTPTT